MTRKIISFYCMYVYHLHWFTVVILVVRCNIEGCLPTERKSTSQGVLRILPKKSLRLQVRKDHIQLPLRSLQLLLDSLEFPVQPLLLTLHSLHYARYGVRLYAIVLILHSERDQSMQW